MMSDSGGASDPQTEATIAAVTAFNDALNRHDLDAVMALMTADCRFENT
jgi:ketosteroid isomerase-like protein